MRDLPDSPVSDGIAIIGMSGRFPGARNLSEFWNNLRSGVESITFFSAAELTAAGVDTSLTQHPDFVNAGGILDGIELFDAAFFGFSAREAETLDPQQRILLECAWEAMEDAGYDSARCSGPVGVYAGSAMSTYLFSLLAKPGHRQLVGDFVLFTGNDKDFLSTRVSYKLNLRGPSIAVQTACSTSLVAVAMACDSLFTHQCDMALAGGVAIRVPQKSGYMFQEGRIFSRDGHTRSFDAAASGTLFSNGVGLVVLKRVADAIRDGDCIRAVIRGSAINNDGGMKVGYAAPGLDAQAEVVARAHALAEVDPRTIDYVEGHGTGTPMGDPIEVAALSEAFRAATSDTGFCALGSLKSNVGHLDSASGIAALIKVVLSLQHGEVPPTINFSRPNPAIDFKTSPFYVNTQLMPWKAKAAPRRAGVHSFGIGGTNAHVVVEEAPAVQASDSLRPWHLLLLSARSKVALEAAIRNFAAYFQRHPDANLADIAYTCQMGRRAFARRFFLVCNNANDAASALAQLPTAPINFQRTLMGTTPPGNRSLAFLFPGLGSQRENMGLEIYQAEPAFRSCVDECSALLKQQVGFDLREVLYPPHETQAGTTPHLDQPEVVELALFVFEYALARLWMEWGVRPNVLIGESIGEFVAACLAGVFSLADALYLLAERSRLLKGMHGGGMLAAVPALRAVVARIRLHPPQIPFVSNTTGTWITAASATDSEYWSAHSARPMLFAEGMERLVNTLERTVLVLGPRGALAGIARRVPDSLLVQSVIPSVPGSFERASDMECLMTALGRLWLEGTEVDWAGFWSHEKRQRVPLPTYAFERKRYWVDPQPRTEATPNRAAQVSDTARSAATSSQCAAVPERADRSAECTSDASPLAADHIERVVAGIWQELLGIEHVGIYDNFFQLGGHSMQGAQLLSRLRAALNVEVPLPTLFESPTVAGMAERIRAFQ
jgi:acyl transferase domain-containing protein